MPDLDVIDQPATAAAVLDPLRSQVLAALAEPGSASTVAEAIGQPRQKVNYHVRALEQLGLVELVEERPRRGLTERVVQATAEGYVLSPAVLGPNAATVERTDRLSMRYLVALAARMIAEVGDLARRAEAAGKTLPTLSIDTDIRFANPADRAAFTQELADAVTTIAARYHDESATDGRWHRLVVAAHPRPPSTEDSQ
ncbi:MAG: helix-turn-helix domain-containing protein [Actinomycetota bacterium]